MNFEAQVSFPIRGAYVPEKFSTVNTKSAILSINSAKNSNFPSLFDVFKSSNSRNRE